MLTRTACSLFAAALAVESNLAVAQDLRPVEVTPYVATGTSGVAPIGAMITFPVTTHLSAETELGYRPEDGQPDSLSSSISLLLLLPKIGRTGPYLAAGLGVSQYNSPVLRPDGPPVGTQRRLAWTVNAGGGITVPVSPSLDFRTDVRYFDSLGQGEDQFRVAHGVSFDVGRRRK